MICSTPATQRSASETGKAGLDLQPCEREENVVLNISYLEQVKASGCYFTERLLLKGYHRPLGLALINGKFSPAIVFFFPILFLIIPLCMWLRCIR